jgi:predicted site-specific integrase-resolvase
MTKIISIATNQTQPSVLDDAGAASYIGIERRTLRLWRRTKGLPHLKLSSKCIRYRQTDLDKWLDAHRVAINGGTR